ncbi:hypothetical protein HOG27_04710 [bacterium]|nr:hypothetical protein [bacterium]
MKILAAAELCHQLVNILNECSHSVKLLGITNEDSTDVLKFRFNSCHHSSIISFL